MSTDVTLSWLLLIKHTEWNMNLLYFGSMINPQLKYCC